ncbi:hypothetical protein [Rhodoferax sp.]|uniref:hypothetical protein n=1 Tax=Rhodoferax sp. TaxID=50421 RepID=UPI00275F642C|nr:hypothetical protein [Rhodoferax sp.]
MNLLTTLLRTPGQYTGHGVNHEGERFHGALEVQPLVNNSALMLHYTATREDGVRVHSEATLLAHNAAGMPCLWPVMAELPFVLPHTETSNTAQDDATLVVVFSSGPRDNMEAFREDITIEVSPNGRLRYAHSWGMPGGVFAQRSSCDLVRATDSHRAPA